MVHQMIPQNNDPYSQKEKIDPFFLFYWNRHKFCFNGVGRNQSFPILDSLSINFKIDSEFWTLPKKRSIFKSRINSCVIHMNVTELKNMIYQEEKKQGPRIESWGTPHATRKLRARKTLKSHKRNLRSVGKIWVAHKSIHDAVCKSAEERSHQDCCASVKSPKPSRPFIH